MSGGVGVRDCSKNAMASPCMIEGQCYHPQINQVLGPFAWPSSRSFLALPFTSLPSKQHVLPCPKADASLQRSEAREQCPSSCSSKTFPQPATARSGPNQTRASSLIVIVLVLSQYQRIIMSSPLTYRKHAAQQKAAKLARSPDKPCVSWSPNRS